MYPIVQKNNIKTISDRILLVDVNVALAKALTIKFRVLYMRIMVRGKARSVF